MMINVAFFSQTTYSVISTKGLLHSKILEIFNKYLF